MSPSADSTRPGAEPKLFLHIGMPKTGTTSLQRILHTNGPALAARGYVYPSRWVKGDPGGHHDLTESIRTIAAPAGPSRDHAQARAISLEVCEFLSECRDQTVILSAEGLASALLAERMRPAFAGFVEQCATVADTTVVMAVRRLDEFLASAYLQVTKRVGRGGGSLTAEQYVHSRGHEWTDGLFSGIRWFRKQAVAKLVLVPYLECRDSLPDLLRAVGIDDATDLRSGPSPRTNRRLGLKAQAVLLLPDQALRVLGVRRRRQLIDLFSSGEFAFRDETYDYEALGHELRSEIQERALKAAERFGIDEYTTAFSDAELPSAPRTRIDTSLISGDDLSDLARAVAAQGRERRANASKRAGGPRDRKRQTGDVAHRPRPAPSGRS
jgi:hypothetical protein